MALFNKNNRKGGLMDEIRCDEPSYLIWKWHPSGSQPGCQITEKTATAGFLSACKRWRSCCFRLQAERWHDARFHCRAF